MTALPICIKYFFLFYCSFTLFRKLLNLTITKEIKVYQFVSSLILATLIYFIRLDYASFSILVLAITLILVTQKLYKQSINVTIVSGLIALGCSYALFLISLFILSPLHLLLLQLIEDQYVIRVLSVLNTSCLQMVFSIIPFRFNRFKNGMPFLKQQGASDIGTFTAISSLIAVTLFNLSTDYSPSLLILLSFVILSGILIFFWWKSKLTENYWKQAKEREINELKSEIAELKEYNATLSKIIHKDNKLIPAMLLSVNDTISETCESADEAQRRRLTGILSQLNDVAKERKGLVLFSESEAKANYATGVPKIDSQLKYQAAVAYSSQSCFDVMISDKLNVIVPEIISAEDLRTLVADLLTNALIAVKSEPKRNVLFHTHIENDTFCIDFYDSGAPFDAEVLEKIGKERITTHLDDGGSGIGYMTTFEILNRCNGTWTVDENLNLELYTKKVRICFPLEANH